MYDSHTYARKVWSLEQAPTFRVGSSVRKDLGKVGVFVIEGYVRRVGSHELTNYFWVEGVLQ